MKKAGVSIGLLIVLALLAWWLWPDKKAAAAAPGRVSRELDVDVNVESPYFGLTDDEIAAEKAKRNPAVDPEMRLAIDRSSVLIDDYFTTDPSDLEAP